MDNLIKTQKQHIEKLHKQAEQALKDSEKRYKDLVEKTGIAILIDDEEGNFIHVNERYAEIFGFSVAEMKTQSLQSRVYPDDVEIVMKYHNGRVKGKNVPSKYEYRGVRKDGSITYLEVYAEALKRGGGNCRDSLVLMGYHRA